MKSTLTLSTAIKQYLEHQQTRKGRSKDTITTYRSTFNLFLEYAGDTPVEELTTLLIDQYADTLLHLAPRTRYNRLVPIRGLVGFLYSRSHIDMRKEAVDLPPATSAEANFLELEEQRQLIEACKGFREKAIILCLLRSGLRVSELINLESDDLYERSLVARSGKGKKPRVTFITEDAEDAIRMYSQSHQYPQRYLFPNQHGQKLSRQYVLQLVKRVAARTPITKNISPHTLRHTFATNLLRAGARAEDVKPMMGHANIRTTLIYMHFTNPYLKQRFDVFMQKAIA